MKDRSSRLSFYSRPGIFVACCTLPFLLYLYQLSQLLGPNERHWECLTAEKMNSIRRGFSAVVPGLDAAAQVMVENESPPWPGKPSYDLSGDTQLVRIGNHLGPIQDARDYVKEHLEEFLAVYEKRPDKSNTCGIRFNHAMAIYMITKRLQPQTIIESGINSGQSTFFFRQASATARIISLDPLPKPICGQPVRFIDDTNNEYLTGSDFIDFDAVDWKSRIENGSMDPANTLVLVDDHQGFFKRFPTIVKYGMAHIMNEDNYQRGEGATSGDRANLMPKQMWRRPNHPDTVWLFHNLKVYAEFPPLLPPSMSSNSTIPKKKAGAFLHHTDDLSAIEEPILRPDLDPADHKLFQTVAERLGLDMEMKDSESYQELMGYCFIGYMHLVPMSPLIAKALFASS